MPRSIFEQTSHETFVVRKNLSNANLCLDEGKIERERKRLKMKDVYIYICKEEERDTFHLNSQSSG
jgi:hypothetical protein